MRMERVINVLKKHKIELIIFITVLLLELILFFPWIKGHYATDTYRLINLGYKDAARDSLKDGRAFMYLIGNIANFLNVSVENYARVLLILALIVSCFSVIVFRRIILKHIEDSNIQDTVITALLAFTIIFNYMYLENLYYVEAFVMSLSILLNIIIANLMIEEKKHYHIKALILTIISFFLYQGTVCFLIASYFFLLIIKKEKKIKGLFLKIVLDFSIILIAGVINTFCVKFINYILGTVQVRTSSVSIYSIIINIITIFSNMSYVLTNTCGLFPAFLFLIFLFIVSILIVIDKNNKDKALNLSELYMITIISILAGFSTNVLVMSCFYAGRIKFSIGALIGLLLTYLYTQIKSFRINETYKMLLVLVLCTYGLFNILNYSSIIKEHIEVNKLEKLQIEELGKQIEEYEKNSSQKIEHVKVVISNGSSYFEEINHKCTLTSGALRCSWAAVGAINFYLNKNYSEEVISYYEYKAILDASKSIDINNKKDIVFLDDTLYIEVYDY